MQKINDCFPLRYNLQRSGYNFADNEKIFAEMFGESEEFIKETLIQYRDVLAESSKKITDELDLADFNAQLTGKNILFVGDSITSERLSYEKIIDKALKCNCYDEAISGSRSVDVLINIQNALEKFTPDIVIIMIGTNDAQCVDRDHLSVSVSETEYKRNIKLITQIVAKYSAHLIYISVPYVHKGKIPEITSEYAKKYNKILEEISDEYKIELINTCDLFSQFPDEILFEPDGIHLSPFAQYELAKRVLLQMKSGAIARFM